MPSSDPQIIECPVSIKLIAIMNALAALLTFAFWTLVFLKLPSPADFANIPERANMATTFAFGIADMIWSLPLLLIAAAGLWQMRFWGWVSAQMVNALWWYSLSVIVTRDLYTQTLSPGTVIFLPFAIFAFWAAWKLWEKRELF